MKSSLLSNKGQEVVIFLNPFSFFFSTDVSSPHYKASGIGVMPPTLCCRTQCGAVHPIVPLPCLVWLCPMPRFAGELRPAGTVLSHPMRCGPPPLCRCHASRGCAPCHAGQPSLREWSHRQVAAPGGQTRRPAASGGRERAPALMVKLLGTLSLDIGD